MRTSASTFKPFELFRIELLATHFGLDPNRTVYMSPRDNIPENADAFLASNEYHWPGLPKSRLSADVVVSIGSNMGWDQVLENKGKALVLLDYDPSIAQIHEWVYRPLLLLAQTPAEFLSYLSLFRTTEIDVVQFFEDFKNFTESDAQETVAQIHEFAEHIVSRVETIATIRRRAVQGLKDYFKAVCGARGCLTCKGGEYPFKLGHFQWQLETHSGDLSYMLLKHFKSRYIHDREFINCWLSCPGEFTALKAIFKDHLYYCVANLFSDTKIWTRLGELFGFSTFSINVSNVIEFVYSMTVGSRRPQLLKGLNKELYDRYRGKSCGEMRLDVLHSIDSFLGASNTNLAAILFYYTIGGLDLRALHTPKSYIHISGVPVTFGELK